MTDQELYDKARMINAAVMERPKPEAFTRGWPAGIRSFADRQPQRNPADPDWLTYLVGKMEAGNLAACGGPNFPPPEDSAVAAYRGGAFEYLLNLIRIERGHCDALCSPKTSRSARVAITASRSASVRSRST